MSQASTTKAQAGRVGDALAVADSVDVSIPAWPADCAKHEAMGLGAHDRLDAALLKADAAISRGNARVDRCTQFYESLKNARAKNG